MSLPTGNHFGVSATSAEVPDSFEVFKFVVTTDSDKPESQEEHTHEAPPVHRPNPRAQPASDIKNDDARFADLHDRLATLQQQISALHTQVLSDTSPRSRQHQEVLGRLAEIESAFLGKAKTDPVATQNLDRKIERIMADVRQTKTELHSALEKHVAGLQLGIQAGNDGVGRVIKAGSPGWFQIAALLAASQAVTVVGYWIYKTKRRAGSKKFL